MVEKLKQKRSESKLAIARHTKAVNQGAVTKEVKKPKTVNKNDVVLNVSIIQDRLDSALEEAIELYKTSANRLGIDVDVDKCKSSRRDLDNFATLKTAYDTPENRQLIGAYISAREALHDLSNRVEKAKIFDGDMTQVDIYHLLYSFRLLGMASYCIFDEYLREDFEGIEKIGIEKGFDAHEIAAKFLPKAEVNLAPSYTNIAARNEWIRLAIVSLGAAEVIRLWNQKNPDYMISRQTIKNATKSVSASRKNNSAQPIQSKVISRMIHMGRVNSKK